MRKGGGGVYRGLGIRLSDFEASKPQKVGGCGWYRPPWNRVFEPRSPVVLDGGYSPFREYVTAILCVLCLLCMITCTARISVKKM